MHHCGHDTLLRGDTTAYAMNNRDKIRPSSKIIFVRALLFFASLDLTTMAYPFTDRSPCYPIELAAAVSLSLAFGLSPTLPRASILLYSVPYFWENYHDGTQIPTLPVMSALFCILMGIHRDIAISAATGMVTLYGVSITPGNFVPSIEPYSGILWLTIVLTSTSSGYAASYYWARKSDDALKERAYRRSIAVSLHSSVISNLTLSVIKLNQVLEGELTDKQRTRVSDARRAAELAILDVRRALSDNRDVTHPGKDDIVTADYVTDFSARLRKYGFTVLSEVETSLHFSESPLMSQLLSEMSLNILKYGSDKTPVSVALTESAITGFTSIKITNGVSLQTAWPKGVISSGCGLEFLGEQAQSVGWSLHHHDEGGLWVSVLSFPSQLLKCP